LSGDTAGNGSIMIKPRTAACTAAVALSVIALTACSAIENKQAHSVVTSSTQAPVSSPRTEATTPPPNPPPAAADSPPIGDVSLEIDDRGDLGEIVVDGTGRTVYAFSRDPLNEPTCYDACADTWLPLLARSHPASGIGIDVGSADVVVRHDGGNQVTYKGIPLYRYAGDKIDRDANGQGLNLFDGEWHVLTKDGLPLA
jgi:predicted lipoprotein with Yx(FWY)xxD motif